MSERVSKEDVQHYATTVQPLLVKNLALDLLDARRRIADLERELYAQIEAWESVPSGVDYDANPEDPSPEDAVAHLAGLMIRSARQALGLRLVLARAAGEER